MLLMEKFFWKQIIEGKYGKEGAGWHSCEVRGGYGVDVWNAIRKGWDLFFTRTSFEVSNGKRIKFWMDKRSPYLTPFPLYICWLCQRRPGWWVCRKT